MGVFGFVFWLLAAHLYSSSSIGRAGTVISTMVLISFISDLGLSNTLVRVLPTSDDMDSEINLALVLTTGMAMVIATAYLLVAPSLVPRLDFLRANTLDAIGFVLLNGCAAANLLTDSVFIARRRSHYNLLVDGIFQGVAKLACLGGFVGLSAYGIFLSNGIGGAVAVVASLIVMVWRLGYHPSLKVDIAVFIRNIRFSLTNYVASVFQLLPLLLLPIIVLNDEGARHAAYFFIAFNLANLTYAVPFAMGQSLFAEGSQGKVDIRALARRAARIVGPVTLVMAVVIAGSVRWILLIYGHTYSHNATPTLIVMVAALPIVAFNNNGQVLLKLQGRVRTLVVVNVASFVVILGLAEVWGPKSLPLVGLAWLLGNLVAALLASVGSLLPGKAAHRRPIFSRRGSHAAVSRREQGSPATRGTPYSRGGGPTVLPREYLELSAPLGADSEDSVNGVKPEVWSVSLSYQVRDAAGEGAP